MEKDPVLKEGNRLFWESLASYSNDNQLDFINASSVLGEFLVQDAAYDHQPLSVEYVKNTKNYRVDSVDWGAFTTYGKPPDGLNWWGTFKWHLKESFRVHTHNKIATDMMIYDAVTTNWETIRGYIGGDFEKNPTISQVIVGGVISMIPIVDQVCDVRDLIANIIDLSTEEGRDDTGNWVNLAITCTGFIPLAGSAIKTVVKATRTVDINKRLLLDNMEYLESTMSTIGMKLPWGRAPERWLQEKPWQKVAENTIASSRQVLDRLYEQFKHYAEWFDKNIIGNPQIAQLLHRLTDTVEKIKEKIDEYIRTVCQQVEDTVDRLLGQPNYATAYGSPPLPNQTGQYSINTSSSGGGNQVPHQQPARPIPTQTMRQKRVGCFNRVDTPKARSNAQTNIDRDHPPGSKGKTVDQYLNDETDRQLKQQQDALNRMSVKDYEDGRAAFGDRGRGDGLDQKQARKDYETDLKERYTAEYERNNPNLSEFEVEQKAEADTQSVMATLAALHNPDQVVGGAASDAALDMGLGNVNSSIGSQWKNTPKGEQLSRVGSIDAATAAIPEHERINTRMNVNMERCK